MHTFRTEGTISSDLQDPQGRAPFSASTLAIYNTNRNTYDLTATIPVRAEGPIGAIGINANLTVRPEGEEQHSVSVAIFPREGTKGQLRDALKQAGIEVVTFFNTDVTPSRRGMFNAVGLDPGAEGWELAGSKQSEQQFRPEPQSHAVDVIRALGYVSLPGQDQGERVLPDLAYGVALATAVAVTPDFLVQPIAEQDRLLNKAVATINPELTPTAPGAKGQQVTAKGIGFGS